MKLEEIKTIFENAVKRYIKNTKQEILNLGVSQE